MTIVRLLVISAGLSSPSSTRRLADDLTASAVGRLEAAGDVDSIVVDAVELRDLAHQTLDALLTGDVGPDLTRARLLVEQADALIVATPVYKGSYSGLFKTFIDAVDPSAFMGKPVLLSATGGSPRHALVVDQELRPLFGFLQALTVPTGVFATASDCTADVVPDFELRARIERAVDELSSLLHMRAPVGEPAV